MNLQHNTTITLQQWLDAGLSYELFKSDKKRGYIITHVRGGNGRQVLIEVHSMYKQDRKRILLEKYPELQQPVVKSFKESIEVDEAAVSFFSEYRYNPSTGSGQCDDQKLPANKILQYSNDAALLNALKNAFYNNTRARALGKSMRGFWKDALAVVKQLSQQWPNTLPGSTKRLKNRFDSYCKDGYAALISGKFGNQNSRKVNDNIERLIVSLYTLPNKPYTTDVCRMYQEFIKGEIEVFDYATGELFDAVDLMRNNAPVEISEATVWMYLNKPNNLAVVDKVRTGGLEFINTHRPHRHRHRPIFSLSRITLDDRDISHLMPDGSRAKCYYAFDWTSQALIGYSHSQSKDKDLFISCIRNMFQFLEQHDLGTPLEIEVEHHLVNTFADGIAKAGVLFPHVHWCAAGVSREKYAENRIRAKKYKQEKHNQPNIGRHYSKLEANRPKVDKVWTEEGMKNRVKFKSFEEIVADDIRSIIQYNNDLHSDQKTYPGKTRMDVFLENASPKAVRLDKAFLYKFIGNKTTTTILNNQYVRLQYQKFQLPNPRVIGKLKPNNYTVDAYWLPDEKGIINEIYMYQGEKYITTAVRIETYNVATAEQTERDREIFLEQTKYVNSFDGMIKEGKEKLHKLRVIEKEQKPVFDRLNDIEPVLVDETAYNEEIDIEQLADNYDSEYYKQRALNEI